MEVQTVSQPNVLLDHRAVEAEVGISNFAGLSLRTAEGDTVELSFASEFSFSRSQSETVSGGAVTRKISTVAQAAARYSLAIEGDLNEDELNAIQELAERIEPIAIGFFLNGEFDFDEAAETLTASLGVITEVELQLERTIAATFAVQETRLVENPDGSRNVPELNAASIDPAPFLGLSEGQEFLNFPEVRDITELVRSVVETEFPARGRDVLGSEAIVRSLRDLITFLRERLSVSLEGVEPANQGGGDNAEPAAETLAPAPADVQDFVEV